MIYIYILYKIPRIPNFFIYSWAPAQRVVPRCSQVFAEKTVYRLAVLVVPIFSDEFLCEFVGYLAICGEVRSR